MNIRDRIKELRRVPASELRPSPKNWRTHPQMQQDALKRALDDGHFTQYDRHLPGMSNGVSGVTSVRLKSGTQAMWQIEHSRVAAYAARRLPDGDP